MFKVNFGIFQPYCLFFLVSIWLPRDKTLWDSAKMCSKFKIQIICTKFFIFLVSWKKNTDLVLQLSFESDPNGHFEVFGSRKVQHSPTGYGQVYYALTVRVFVSLKTRQTGQIFHTQTGINWTVSDQTFPDNSKTGQRGKHPCLLCVHVKKVLLFILWGGAD